MQQKNLKPDDNAVSKNPKTMDSFLETNSVYFFVFAIVVLIILGVDYVIGESAEYFNAWSFVVDVTEEIHGKEPLKDTYIHGQDSLGDFVPFVALLALIVEAGIPTIVIVWLVRFLAKKTRSEN